MSRKCEYEVLDITIDINFSYCQLLFRFLTKKCLFVTEEILYSITAVSDQGVDGWMTSLLLLLTAKAAVKVSSKTFYTVNWYSDFCLSE